MSVPILSFSMCGSDCFLDSLVESFNFCIGLWQIGRHLLDAMSPVNS